MKIKLPQIKLKSLLDEYWYPLIRWHKGDTGFLDKDGTPIYAGDFVEAYDHTGRRWTAFIRKKIFKGHSRGLNIGKYTFVFVFESNYGTWLNKDYAKELRVIKSYADRL